MSTNGQLPNFIGVPWECRSQSKGRAVKGRILNGAWGSVFLGLNSDSTIWPKNCLTLLSLGYSSIKGRL